MIVAVCTIRLFVPEAGSLKGKRHVVKGLIQRIAARTGASVAETDFQDLWQRAEIGVAMVSNERAVLERQVNQIRGILDDCAEAETVSFDVEFY